MMQININTAKIDQINKNIKDCNTCNKANNCSVVKDLKVQLKTLQAQNEDLKLQISNCL